MSPFKQGRAEIVRKQSFAQGKNLQVRVTVGEKIIKDDQGKEFLCLHTPGRNEPRDKGSIIYVCFV